MTKILLISVKPRFARALLEGRKTVEVRRRFPDLPVGTVVVIYASSPERAVLGAVRLKYVMRVDPNEVWGLHAGDIEIDEHALIEYLAGATESTLLKVESPEVWARPVSLATLRDTLGLDAPQSFRYINSEQVALMRDLGKGVEIAHDGKARRRAQADPLNAH